jgi:chromosomal replication initiator protein
VSRILKAVSARLEVPEDRLTSKPGRKGAVARDAAVYLSRRLTSLGVQEIGRVFGGLAPAQVVEISRRVERERDSDQAFAAVLDEIAEEAKNAS